MHADNKGLSRGGADAEGQTGVGRDECGDAVAQKPNERTDPTAAPTWCAELGIIEHTGADAARDVREARREAERNGAPNPLDGLVEKIKATACPALAMDRLVIDCAAYIRVHDPFEYEQLRGQLQAAGLGISRWESLVSKRCAEVSREAKWAREDRLRKQRAEEHAAHQLAVERARAERAVRGEALSEDPNSAWAEDELTDLGNSERLVREHGADFRYCPKQKVFYCWDGTRWARDDDDGTVTRFAKDTLRAFKELANDTESRQWALKSQSFQGITAMVRLVKSNAAIVVAPDAFDTDPWVFNCANGTLDLKTNTLRPHRREDLITKRSPVTYDPTADPETCAPLFRRFHAEVQPDPEVRAYQLRHAGYSLTGVIRDHVIVINWGGGRNGKGVYANIAFRVMGDYAASIPTEVLMATKFDAHPAGKMTLFGLRFAVASETEEGRAFNVAAVKQLTGGDPIRARGMRENFIEFLPTHKLWLACNPKPEIGETNPAIWQRVHFVPWTVTFEDHEQDKQLGEKLAAEEAGVLRLFVEGCMEWQRIGLEPPGAVRAATQELRIANDDVGEFLAERCVVTGRRDAKEPGKSLYKAYIAWSEEGGGRALPKNVFGEKLLSDRKRGITRSKYAGMPMYWGVRLLTEQDLRERARAAEAGDECPPTSSEVLPDESPGHGEDGEDGEDVSGDGSWMLSEIEA